jgi:hypothetical protein
MKQPTKPSEGADAPPWVRDGLRALREQEPSEESRRAALARLGIDPGSPASGRTPPLQPSTLGGLWRWLAWGLVLGVIAVLLRRFL